MPNPSRENATRFGILRHAQTAWNQEKRIQGQIDTPLAETGMKQAVEWAGILAGMNWDLILSSNLERARSTARILNRALSLPEHLDERLREQDWGRWVGQTVADLHRDSGRQLQAQEKAGWDFCPPGGEDRRRLRDRSRRALLEAARRWPGRTILVITHEGVIKALVYDLLERDFLPGEPKVLRKGYWLHWLTAREDTLAVEALHGVKLPDVGTG